MNNKLRVSLCLLRFSIFGVMLIWTVDKFVNPAHGVTVYQHFYFFSGVDATVMKILGGIELAVLLAFLAGWQKIWTYGAVMTWHAVSTLSAFKQYLAPFDGPNLLFFAAWPMLAACVTLFLLRDEDRLLTAG